MTTLKRPDSIARRLVDLTLARLALEDQIKTIRDEEQELLALGAQRFRETGESRIGFDGVGSVTLVKQPIATVKDWKAVLAFAAEHPDAGVVHKRLSPTAIEKLSFDGVVVPGAVLDHQFALNVNVREARKKAKS